MASGESSMMISIPVSDSRVRIFRPSRPMIRPLISSLSILNTETVFSMACSLAVRWIVSIMTFFASVLAVSLASSTISLICMSASALASSFSVSISCSLASAAERVAMVSSLSICCLIVASRSPCFLFTISSWLLRFCLIVETSFCFLENSSIR